eukprot:141645_1
MDVLTDLREDVLYENENDEHKVSEAYDMIPDSNAPNERLILNDATRNAELRTLKQKSILKLDGKDLSRIRKKLHTIFVNNSMDILPWIMNDLSLYLFYSKRCDSYVDKYSSLARCLSKHIICLI